MNEPVSKPIPICHPELDSGSIQIPKQVRNDGFETGSTMNYKLREFDKGSREF